MRKKRRLARALAPIVVRIYLNIESNLFPCLRGLIYYYAKPILFFTSAVQVHAFFSDLVFHPYPFPCADLFGQSASSSVAPVRQAHLWICVYHSNVVSAPAQRSGYVDYGSCFA